MSRHPTVEWAQRSDVLFLTFDLPDAKDVNLKLEPEGKLYFSAKSGADNIPYEVDLNLYDKVNVDESKSRIGSRNIVFLVKKEESKWWSRLLKQEGKPPVFLKVDWDKWVDEDEQDEKIGADMDFGDVDFSNLKMVGEDGPDDDDDEGDDGADLEEELKEETAAKKETKPVDSGTQATSEVETNH